MTLVQNRNPRFNRNFRVRLHLRDYTIEGTAFTPSAFGASVQIHETAYLYLTKNLHLWQGLTVAVETLLVDAPGTINGLFERDEKHFISMKLLAGRSWYR